METRGTGPPPKNRRRAVTAVSPPWTPQPGGGQGLRPRAPPTSPSTVRHDEVVAGPTMPSPRLIKNEDTVAST